VANAYPDAVHILRARALLGVRGGHEKRRKHMRTLLLAGAAALAASTLPVAATAQSLSGSPDSRLGNFHHHRDGRHHRGDFDRDAFFAVPLAPEAWALNNNRSWQSASFNDWWHDRPDRAFPRWVQHNQNCTPDRMWWSGSGWHC
jgi:hypothetical protein